eukprot:1158589-Pelagomonas_calceolata.AAC.4
MTWTCNDRAHINSIQWHGLCSNRFAMTGLAMTACNDGFCNDILAMTWTLHAPAFLTCMQLLLPCTLGIWDLLAAAAVTNAEHVGRHGCKGV